MAESERDTSRATVRTYVPAYQRDQWDDHAEELGMSRSEFVRTMVQAGRRGFGESETDSRGAQTPDPESATEDPGGDRSSDADPQGMSMEDRVVAVLRSAEYLSWDELLEAVADDIEAELEAALQELQSSGRVTYSGRNGGYTIDE
ncbi:DUF5805 domain-containing protein [Halosimplex marinum]|uniref:DUF5805 domain-containing protein n=1 Tax=Halosimplex marinum TaxID=3396620 RepID=UPI003F566616